MAKRYMNLWLLRENTMTRIHTPTGYLVNTPTHRRAHTHKYTHMHTHPHTHRHTYTHTRTHSHTCTHTNIHTHTCTYTHIRTRIHTGWLERGLAGKCTFITFHICLQVRCEQERTRPTVANSDQTTVTNKAQYVQYIYIQQRYTHGMKKHTS